MAVFNRCKALCQSEDSQCFEFDVPMDLRVKNLSSLMNLTDEMQKFEERTESMLKRLYRNYHDLNATQPLTVTSRCPHDREQSPEDYMKSFCWEEIEYGHKQELAKLAGQMFTNVTEDDNLCKNKQATLTQISSRLNAIQRKRSGNLVTRDLADLIKDEHIKDIVHGNRSDRDCPPNSPFKNRVSTAIAPYWIVVAKHREADFRKVYESFSEYVVPRSAMKVDEDKDYILFRILHLARDTLEDDLKNSVEQEHKFVLRNFSYDSQQSSDNSAEEEDLMQQQQAQKRSVTQAIRAAFGHIFLSWIHLKAIRVFVESVLWYSLPANFKVMMIAPNENNSSRLREKLSELFKSAKVSPANMSAGDEEDNLPYVNLDLELDWFFEDNN